MTMTPRRDTHALAARWRARAAARRAYELARLRSATLRAGLGTVVFVVVETQMLGVKSAVHAALFFAVFVLVDWRGHVSRALAHVRRVTRAVTVDGYGVCRRSESEGRPIMAHERYSECIEACNECAVACDHCADACLGENDVTPMNECIRLDRDCAQLCRLAAALMASGSRFAAEACRLCASACDACAAECEKHEMEHCRECAEACRRCADECRQMAVAAGHPMASPSVHQ